MLDINYEIINVEVENQKSLDKFKEFYNTLFLSEFSAPEICESFEHYINILKLKSENRINSNDVFITLIYDNENIIGGIIYVYLSNVNSGVVEYEVISSNYRKYGFGKILYDFAKTQLNLCSQKNGKNFIDFVFGEASNPEIVEQYNVYEKYWNKLGFKRLDLNYIQPPINRKSSEDRDYILIVDSSKHLKNIKLELMEEIINEFFKFSFQIKNPKITKQYKEMFDSKNTKKIDILD